MCVCYKDMSILPAIGIACSWYCLQLIWPAVGIVSINISFSPDKAVQRDVCI